MVLYIRGWSQKFIYNTIRILLACRTIVQFKILPINCTDKQILENLSKNLLEDKDCDLLPFEQRSLCRLAEFWSLGFTVRPLSAAQNFQSACAKDKNSIIFACAAFKLKILEILDVNWFEKLGNDNSLITVKNMYLICKKCKVQPLITSRIFVFTKVK